MFLEAIVLNLAHTFLFNYSCPTTIKLMLTRHAVARDRCIEALGNPQLNISNVKS